ncbi:hypothetical protein PM082_019683 [Marasmius tenuissimus]|nr:hypothetical protein PM082_019683 [Marasmius tenuissimus]
MSSIVPPRSTAVAKPHSIFDNLTIRSGECLSSICLEEKIRDRGIGSSGSTGDSYETPRRFGKHERGSRSLSIARAYLLLCRLSLDPANWTYRLMKKRTLNGDIMIGNGMKVNARHPLSS